MTLLERFDKYGISRHANVREIRRAIAIAQAVEDCASVSMEYSEILQRADELLANEGR